MAEFHALGPDNFKNPVLSLFVSFRIRLWFQIIMSSLCAYVVSLSLRCVFVLTSCNVILRWRRLPTLLTGKVK